MQTTSFIANDVSIDVPDQPQSPRLDTVGACVSPGLVRVPSWFTVGAALRVAQCKGVEHLLVVDRGSVVGTIATRAVRAAPAAQPLGRWMTPVTITLSPETARAEAAWLMDSLGVECLPVSSGLLLVGLVTRGDLAADEQRRAG